MEITGLLLTVSVRGIQTRKLYLGSRIVIGHNLGILRGREDISGKSCFLNRSEWGIITTGQFTKI